MTETKTKRLTRKTLVNFLEKYTYEKEGEGFTVYSGKEARERYEYTENARWFVTYDGGNMYDLMQGWNDGAAETDWSFAERFNAFLKEYGLMYEPAYSWASGIYPDY